MNTFQIILLVLLTAPVVEIFLLVQVGGVIGVFPTVLLIVGTGGYGAYLFHVQGLATWARLQSILSRGELPTLELVEGPLVLLGGILLLTPGFLSDVLGLCCLMPGSRRWLAAYLLERGWLKAALAGWRPAPSRDSVIEGEFRRDGD